MNRDLRCILVLGLLVTIQRNRVMGLLAILIPEVLVAPNLLKIKLIQLPKNCKKQKKLKERFV